MMQRSYRSRLLEALARRAHGWAVLTRESTVGLSYEVRVRGDHCLPAWGLHHIVGVTKTTRDDTITA